MNNEIRTNRLQISNDGLERPHVAVKIRDDSNPHHALTKSVAARFTGWYIDIVFWQYILTSSYMTT